MYQNFKICKDEFPYLSEQWILYPNGTSNILYELSLYESRHFVLDGVSGVLLSLLDGSRTFADYVSLVTDLFSFPSESKAEIYCISFFTDLNNNQGEEIVKVSKNKLYLQKKYSELEFIVNKDVFEYPKRLKSPIRLLVFPTGRCTTNCIYCYADLNHLRKFKELDLKHWTNIFEQAKSLGIYQVDISGGDLFARDDATEFICKMIDFGFIFYLSTKSYISYEDALKIVQAGFNTETCGVNREIQLSIDCIDDSVASLLVNADNYPDRIFKTAKNLIRAGISPIIKAVITPYNSQGLDDLVCQFYNLGIRKIHISKYEKSFYRHNDKYLLDSKQEEYLVQKIENIQAIYSDILFSGDLTSSGRGKNNSHTLLYKNGSLKKDINSIVGCSGGRTTLGILPNGMCCLCEQMELKKPFIFGDLKTQSILEIWNSKEIETICFPDREKFKGTECFNCDDFFECVTVKGQCFRDNYFGLNKNEIKGSLFQQYNNCYRLSGEVSS